MAINQTITQLPTPPSTTDVVNFNDRADNFLAAIPTFVTQANTVIEQINSTETNINSKEASATNSANSAIAAANFQGTWTNQTTQIGQSWEFEGIVYRVLIAGNTSPTSSPLNWTSIATTSDALMDEINLKLGISATAANSTKWNGATMYTSTSAASGGVDGDIWFQY